jgi:hypothetical protein
MAFVMLLRYRLGLNIVKIIYLEKPKMYNTLERKEYKISSEHSEVDQDLTSHEPPSIRT